MKFQFPNYRDRTLPRLLDYQVRNNPEKKFIRFCSNSCLTFSQINDLTNRIAAGLQKCGLDKGEPIALLLPNCEEFVPLWFAAAKLGAIETPLNPQLVGRLLKYVLADSSAKILVCHASILDQTLAVILQYKLNFEHVIVVGNDNVEKLASPNLAGLKMHTYENLCKTEPKVFSIDVVEPCDPIAIMYTSGTTGMAKGVVSSHHQHYMWAERIAHNMDLTSSDVYYTPLPLFHGDAQFYGVYFPLVFGASGAIYERFSASRFWEQIEESRATATNMLGAMAHILWKQPEKESDKTNTVRVCQAIPMIEIQEKFESRFQMELVTAYGQTETSLVTYDTPNSKRKGSCGRASDDFEVAIIDSNDERLPNGSIGEIALRPIHPWRMFLGYHAKAEHTAHAWRNLWFHTGDTGYLDSDGWLFFSGRIKDVIRRRGENISAQEVESVIQEIEDIIECAAIAVPSELSEDDIKVVVVKKRGSNLCEAALINFCNERMPRYMVPRYVEFRKELLPRTPSEKIAKEILLTQGITSSTWDRDS